MTSTQPESLVILGYGRFGEALTGLLKGAGYAVRVFDPAASVPAALAQPSLEAAVRGATWVVLAMPVARMRETLLTLRPMLDAGQTVIDVGSVKQRPCAWMDEILGTDIPHAGTHPLFGPLSLARGDRPRRTVLCTSAQHPEAAARTRKLFETLDCEIIDHDPALHDRKMAYTHAMTFFIAKALVEMGVGEDLSMAPPSFQGLGHMLDAVRGDAGHLFATIQRENPYAAEARAALIDHLQRINTRLESDADDLLSIPEGHHA